MTKRILFLLLAAALALSACGGGETAPTSDPNAVMTLAFATVNASFTLTALAVPTHTPLPTETPTSTPEPTPSVFEPTTLLTGSVNTGVAYCRFGPEQVYVARYGLRFGKSLEVIGRTSASDWLLVREVGGATAKSCWISAPLLAVTGDLATLAVAPVTWVTSQKYPPPSNILATRNGSAINLTWEPVKVDQNDIYNEGRYLLEVWLCQGGVLSRSLVSVKGAQANLTDEPGCAEPSHGQLYTSTRDGYSIPAPITPWP
ncbi:MAG: hypothetical protein HY867_06590 [Chloroflexi bacterium]|nr:hypothetical protein [Chloroflexota bacterium]